MTTPIRLGGTHCCACAGACHHVGGIQLCAEHRQPTGWHPCRIERQRDPHAYVEQYTIRCHCHDRAETIWRPGDPAYRCPTTGADEEATDAAR